MTPRSPRQREREARQVVIDVIKYFGANCDNFHEALAAYARAILRPERVKKVKRCAWTEDEDGNWDTRCGEKHVLIDGTPADNGMQFCCYCGGTLADWSNLYGGRTEVAPTVCAAHCGAWS